MPNSNLYGLKELWLGRFVFFCTVPISFFCLLPTNWAESCSINYDSGLKIEKDVKYILGLKYSASYFI